MHELGDAQKEYLHEYNRVEQLYKRYLSGDEANAEKADTYKEQLDEINFRMESAGLGLLFLEEDLRAEIRKNRVNSTKKAEKSET